MDPSVVAIIPCYNVARFCTKVVEKTVKEVGKIIAIDDGSTDDTAALLAEQASLHPGRIEIITFPRNRGKGFGLLEGMKRAAKGKAFDVLVTIDCDGQHDPNDIGKLVEEVRKGADLVIGRRPFEKMTPLRAFGNRMIAWMCRLKYRNTPRDIQSGFRAMNKHFVGDVIKHVRGGGYEMEFVYLLYAMKKQKKIAEVPIRLVLNKNQTSHFSFFRDSIKNLRVLFNKTHR